MVDAELGRRLQLDFDSKAENIFGLIIIKGSEEISSVEKEVERLFPQTRKELVLLHPHGTRCPRYQKGVVIK